MNGCEMMDGFARRQWLVVRAFQGLAALPASRSTIVIYESNAHPSNANLVGASCGTSEICTELSCLRHAHVWQSSGLLKQGSWQK